MSGDNVRLLVDRNIEDVKRRLFYIDKVDFWLSNSDFVSEYRRLSGEGLKDGFYRFYQAAKNLFSKMKASSVKSNCDFDFGVAHKSIEEMERRLQSGYDDRCSDPRLDFLTKRISAPSVSIRYWLMVPEFVDAVHKMIPGGVRIDDQSIYPIMKRIYLEKAKLRESLGKDGERIPFNFSITRRAIKSVEDQLKIPADERIT